MGRTSGLGLNLQFVMIWVSTNGSRLTFCTRESVGLEFYIKLDVTRAVHTSHRGWMRGMSIISQKRQWCGHWNLIVQNGKR